MPRRSLTNRQRDPPPIALEVLEEIRMPNGLEVLRGIGIRLDRVILVRLKGAQQVFRPRDRHHVLEARSAFGKDEVVVVVFAVHVRTLGPDAAGAVPQVGVGPVLAGRDVDGEDVVADDVEDVARHVGLAVVVPEEVRVEEAEVFVDEAHRHAPGLRLERISRVEDHVERLVNAVLHHERDDHVENSIVVAESRGVYSALHRVCAVVFGDLLFAVDDVADVAPVLQVAAGVDGEAGEVVEGG